MSADAAHTPTALITWLYGHSPRSLLNHNGRARVGGTSKRRFKNARLKAMKAMKPPGK
jgi:hypothetical protein